MPPDGDGRAVPRSQDTVFADVEGDRWFERNVAGVTDEKRIADDYIIGAVGELSVHPRHVLEIGAANGFRLHALHEKFGSRVTGVEPSAAALADGRKKYPEIEFVDGLAAALPLAAGRVFDLVIVNFVFHWIDRATLFKSVAEIDRVVGPDGYLVIGDFLPDSPERVVYHHLPRGEVWTYKQDYAALFTSSHLYKLASRKTLEVGTRRVATDIPSSARAAVSVLRKVADAGYSTREMPHAGRKA